MLQEFIIYDFYVFCLLCILSQDMLAFLKAWSICYIFRLFMWLLLLLNWILENISEVNWCCRFRFWNSFKILWNSSWAGVGYDRSLLGSLGNFYLLCSLTTQTIVCDLQYGYLWELLKMSMLYGNNLSVCQWMNGLRKCSACAHAHTKWNNCIMFSLKKKNILSFATTLMNLECVVLSAMSQTKTTTAWYQKVVVRGWGGLGGTGQELGWGGDKESLVKGYRL